MSCIGVRQVARQSIPFYRTCRIYGGNTRLRSLRYMLIQAWRDLRP